MVEIYVSTDIETDGPVAGKHSLLSIGSAAYTAEKEMLREAGLRRYPTAFDFPFVYWYLMEFVGENPFGYSAIDIKTYSIALLRKPYRMCGRQSMPAEWLDAVPHTHVALDDAVEQGWLFCNMLRANRAVDRR
jgi:hypothetical protein